MPKKEAKKRKRTRGAPATVSAPSAIRLNDEERYILEALSVKLERPGVEVIRRAIRDMGSAYKVPRFQGQAG